MITLRRADDAALQAELARCLGDGEIDVPDVADLRACGLIDDEASAVLVADGVVLGAIAGATRAGVARIDTLALRPEARGRGWLTPVLTAWLAGRGDVRFETADGPLAAALTRLGLRRLCTVHTLRAALRHPQVAGAPARWPGHDAPGHRDDAVIRTAPGVAVRAHAGAIVAWRRDRLLGVTGDLGRLRRALAVMPPGDARCVDVPDGPVLDALERAGWIRVLSRGAWGRG